MIDSSISLSPEPLNEVTIGSEDMLLPVLSGDKKEQFLEKEKRKGVLSGEAYSRAVDRLVLSSTLEIKIQTNVISILDSERK